MHSTLRHWRALFLFILAIAALAVPAGDAVAQTVNVNRDDVLYILPFWGINGATLDDGIADFRTRVGPEGPYVKLGFSMYIFLSMQDWNVDINNPAAVRAAIASNISQIDEVVATAHAHGVPIGLATLTSAREGYDPAQAASEVEDIRNMQWYADNVVARGWWTHSRYARKQFAIQQAYIREIGKELASLMRQYPDTLVAASGDGEIELAFARPNPDTPPPPAPPQPWAQIFADYSPFMVAEFRDWLRLGGLYAAGADFAGQGYSLGARYAGDATPGQDTNGDGHTLNGDFGTNFQTWNLLHFDWSLNDQYMSADPKALPLSAYSSPGLPAQIPGGFDPPRTSKAIGADAWWDLWVLFKQTMLQHHNQEFAKWMTTSQEPGTGATVPPTRWYSYQVPADHLFNQTPQSPNERWYSSMSSLWTADVSPYGSLGITAFNIDYHWVPWCCAVTLGGAAPAIAALDVRWGINEWHPGVLPGGGGVSSDPWPFQYEKGLILQYRPSLLQPFGWDIHNYEIKDTLFQTMLAEVVAALKDGTPSEPHLAFDPPPATVAQPFTLTGWAVDLGKIRGPGRGPGVDRVDVWAYPNPGSGAPAILVGTATYGTSRPDRATAYGAQFNPSGFSLNVRGLPVGRYDIVAFGRSTVTGLFSSTVVGVTIDYGAAGASPTTLTCGATKAGAPGPLESTTAPQVITASYGGPGVPVWSASTTATWLQVTSGPGFGQFTIAVVDPGNTIGASTSLSATVTVRASNVGVSASVPVTLTVKQIGASAAPFGIFDTPVNNATGLQGSFAVTGWSLDDVGVDRVEIWRDPVAGETTPVWHSPYGSGAADPREGKIFIGNPLFVSNSRPDVEGLYPSYPFANRAGWGYLLLSRGLWNQGNGTYKLYAFAFDVEGNSTTLGTKTITVDNANADKPFGALDTPGYGETTTGTFVNFGWALTPPGTSSCRINSGGVLVGIDSGPLVPAMYGDARPDIAAAFPGFLNSANASGAFYVDTTTLSNGMHQIGWLVTDSCGRQDGVGSRLFDVLNGGSGDAVGSKAGLSASAQSATARPRRSSTSEVGEPGDPRLATLPDAATRGATPPGGDLTLPGRPAPPALSALPALSRVEGSPVQGSPVQGTAVEGKPRPTLMPEASRVDGGRVFRPGDQARSSVVVRQLGGDWQPVAPNADGSHVTEVAQGGRIEIQLPGAGNAKYTGFHAFKDERRALPLGSSLDGEAGIFYWQPVPGFLGEFDLVFETSAGPNSPAETSVRISVGSSAKTTIGSKSPDEAMATPPDGAAGRAADLAPADGAGVNTVHVMQVVNAGGTPVVDTKVTPPVDVATRAIDLAPADRAASSARPEINTVRVFAYPAVDDGTAAYSIEDLRGEADRVDWRPLENWPDQKQRPIWLGVAEYSGDGPNLAALFGRQSIGAANNPDASTLPAGLYDLVVYPQRARGNTLEGAQRVRVIVR